MKVTLSEFFLHLLSTKNFYARVANNMQRVEAPGQGTMGVGIRNGRIVLFYDPEFVKRISLQFGVFTIEHEIMHIVLDHIPRYLEMLARLGNNEEERTKAQVVYNIAMDCADNDLLRNTEYFAKAEAEFKAIQLEDLDEGTRAEMTPERLARMGMVLPEKHDLPLNKSFDFYQHELMKRVKLLPPSVVNQIIQDWLHQLGGTHAKWGKARDEKGDGTGDQNGNGEGSEGDGGEDRPMLPEEAQGLAHQLRTQLKQILRKSVKDQTQGRGTVPSNIAEWLEEYLEDSVIPWWEVLTTRIKATKRSKPDRGIMRPNRMLTSMSEEDDTILPALGIMRDPMYRVFFYVDTSGSMNSESLVIARGELTHMLKADEDLEVRYMQGDCSTNFDKVFRSGEELPKEVYGRGGTDFNEYFRYMGKYLGNDETAPDLVIVYTDGYAPGVLPENQFPTDVPVIWLVTKQHAVESLKDYGEVIVCDPEQNETWKYANE
jgi:predicted metal-dependent peptidase